MQCVATYIITNCDVFPTTPTVESVARHAKRDFVGQCSETRSVRLFCYCHGVCHRGRQEGVGGGRGTHCCCPLLSLEVGWLECCRLGQSQATGRSAHHAQEAWDEWTWCCPASRPWRPVYQRQWRVQGSPCRALPRPCAEWSSKIFKWKGTTGSG